jgi:hypothetical protein
MAQRYAVIDAGKVENTILAESGFSIPGKTLVQSDTAATGDLWDGATFTKPPKWASLAEGKAAQIEALAAKRYSVEIGGTTIGGVPIATDRDTQSKLVAIRILAKEDNAYTVRWKTSAGFVTLDAATIIAVADGVRAFVQAAFDREATLIDAIEAATTLAELDAIDLTAGWP